MLVFDKGLGALCLHAILHEGKTRQESEGGEGRAALLDNDILTNL